MIDYSRLKKLISIPSPSGFEKKLIDYIQKELGKNCEVDYHNNLVFTLKGKNPDKIVMIDAHADQLGFLINNVDKEGMITLCPIGGHDLSLIRGRSVTVISDKGTFNGVIDVKPIHLMDSYNDEVPDKTTDVCLDLGIRKRDKVLKYIGIGDPVVLKPVYDDLLENYVTGSGFDDKAGCFILMEVIKAIKKLKRKPEVTLKFVFSSQEEVGCFGSREVARKTNPDLFIGVDVGFATDYPNVEEKEPGLCSLGSGMIVAKGINIYRPAVSLLETISKRNKIPIQYVATDGTGTNAGSVSHACGGFRILDLGIPLRNMHSPVEVLHKKDLESSIKLLTKLLLSKRLGDIL